MAATNAATPRKAAIEIRSVLIVGFRLIVFQFSQSLWAKAIRGVRGLPKHSGGKRYVRLKKAAESGCQRRYFEYDWRLNDAAAVAANP